MVSKVFNFSLFLLLLLSLSAFYQLPNVHAAQETTTANQPKPFDNTLHKISVLLSDKGYNAMSLTLEMVLQSLLPPQLLVDNTTITIFCPTDKAFLSSKHPQPPLTLLQYHVAPSNINIKTLESSSTLPRGSKIDTLLLGHPLVVTKLTGSGQASINGVKIVEWDLYNDGKIIIHGVEEFFDPAFQTLLYPWYDNGGVNGGKKSGNNGSVVKSCSDESSGLMFWLKNKTTMRIIFLETCALLVLALSMYLFTRYFYRRSYEIKYVA